MTAPELPQPIYPTGNPAPGPGTPPPGYGPPLTPPPHHGGSGGSGNGGLGGNKNLLIVAGVVLVVAVLAVVAFALSSDDGDSDASGDRLSTEGGSDDGGDTGGGDASDRAQRVAALQIIGAESSTVSCIAGALEQDQAMLELLENQPDGVVLPDSSEANSYASMIMGCASPGEMLDQMVAALPSFGYGTYEVGCFEQQASNLNSSDWEEFIRIVVQQPDRVSELESLLGELTFC